VNPNFIYDPFAFDNITRVFDEAQQEYLCACNAYYTNTSPDLNDCANYTYLAPDPHVNLTAPTFGPDHGQAPPAKNNDDNAQSDDGDSGGLSSTEQGLAIGLSVGSVVLIGVAQAIYAQWQKQATSAAKKVAQEATFELVESISSSSESSRVGRPQKHVSARTGCLIMIICLLQVILTVQAIQEPLDEYWWSKGPAMSSAGHDDYFQRQGFGGPIYLDNSKYSDQAALYSYAQNAAMNRIPGPFNTKGEQTNSLYYINMVTGQFGMVDYSRQVGEPVVELYDKQLETQLEDYRARGLIRQETSFNLGSIHEGFQDRRLYAHDDITKHPEFGGVFGSVGAFAQTSSQELFSDLAVFPYKFNTPLRGTSATSKKCPDDRLVSTHVYPGTNTIGTEYVWPGTDRVVYNNRYMLRERSCRFTTTTNTRDVRVGAAMVTPQDVTWSMFQYEGIPKHGTWYWDALDPVTTYYALNLCDTKGPAWDACGGPTRGRCISIPATSDTNQAGFRTRWQEDFRLESWVPNVITSWSMNGAYRVRGCRCNDGFTGLKCEKSCPVDMSKVRGRDSPVCSFRGTCDSDQLVTDPNTHRPCQCATGCRCNRGYRGARCEIAVQSKGLYPSMFFPEKYALENFKTCCPDGVPDCSTRSTHSVRGSEAVRYIKPTKPCVGSINTTCGIANEFGTRTHEELDGKPMKGLEFTPRSNAEWDAAMTVHLTAKQEFDMLGNDPCGQSATLHGYAGVANNGRGQCWSGLDYGDIKRSSTFCWCNPHIDVPSYHMSVDAKGVENITFSTTGVAVVRRRGFFGSGCKQRTCTARKNQVWILDLPNSWNPKWVTLEALKDSNGYALQCSGHSSAAFNGNSTKYDDDKQPCNDKAYMKGGQLMNVNTDGRCQQCDHGWGLYAGIYAKHLHDMIPVYGGEFNDQGVCSFKTYHSIGGKQCGGYYKDVLGVRESSRAPLPYEQQRPQSLFYIGGGCDCGPPEWGLKKVERYGDICQRSCTGIKNTAAIPKEWFDSTGAFISNEDISVLVDADPPMCGGYKQGTCRPIVGPQGTEGGWDGFNSACLCNAGYNGPECAIVPEMWHNGKVCGTYGEAMPPTHTKQFSQHLDEDFFFRSIVPLQREQLMSKTAYSGHTCRCPPALVEKGWALFGHICGPTCNALKSPITHQICGGPEQGKCIDNPYPNTIGKICRCEKGWGGEYCDKRILFDELNLECGGPDRGQIVFTGAYNLTQRCECIPPFVPNTHDVRMNGTCWQDCPINPVTKLKCSGEDQGYCSLDTKVDGLNGRGTFNDNVCTCVENAFKGADCSKQLVAVYSTQSGRKMPCTGHGIPDKEQNGFCLCFPGWIGFACEIYEPNRQCGTGQTFLDHEGLGYTVS
jgi:hypothetical protein